MVELLRGGVDVLELFYRAGVLPNRLLSVPIMGSMECYNQVPFHFLYFNDVCMPLWFSNSLLCLNSSMLTDYFSCQVEHGLESNPWEEVLSIPP